MIILPVWAASEEYRDIDFATEFSRYNLLLCDNIQRNGDMIELVRDNEILKTYDKNLLVGFGAGDLTYQLRGAK